ncbi:glycoside hydrolase [Talaromyces proteolyticus]|uniref:chitinase n=1 Tax=Talaromyces proteolyticus TaxID=1131652 RepID=A0AAD4KWW2_9EURO|nr:glycoside hydrolase [Talaromyces proteolyticus]KAH8700682.1 glycoside hydrolase [Talaromyces proteolyticus]
MCSMPLLGILPTQYDDTCSGSSLTSPMNRVKEDGEVYLSDEWADSQMPVDGTEGCLRAFTQLKRQYPQMKVILSVGGGGKGSENFAKVARSPPAVEIFIRSARALVDQFELDGIDVDWEHPSDTQQGLDYIYLLAQLRTVLPAPQYVLTSALPAGEWALKHINLAVAQQYVDVFMVMCYDFSGPWVDRTGHQAQLYTPTKPHNDAASTSCQSAVLYFMSQGVHAKKLLLGVPAYGRSFVGAEHVDQPYSASGGEDGVFDYSELPRPGAKEVVDDTVGAAYCVSSDDGFVSYDNTRTVEQKAKFVTSLGLGGLFYWHIAGDKRGADSLLETGYNTLHEL